MQRALLKIAVLLSVMGGSSYVLYKVNDALPVTTTEGDKSKGFRPLENGEAPTGEESAPEFANNGTGAAPELIDNDPFGMPPPGQDEPGDSQAARFAALAPRSNDLAPPTGQFENANDRALNVNAAGFESPATVAANTEADNSDPFGGTTGFVEPAAASVETHDEPQSNPFLDLADASASVPGLPDQNEPLATEAPAELLDPQVAAAATATEPPAAENTLVALAAASPPARLRAAPPTLTFGNDPEETTAAAAPASATGDPTAEVTAATQPTIEFGAPETVAETAGDPFGSPAATQEPAQPAEGADGVEIPVIEFDAGAGAPQMDPPAEPLEPAPGFGPGFTTSEPLDASAGSLPPAAGAIVPEPAVSAEPNRFPPIDNDDRPAPKTALRSRDLAPLSPAQPEPPFQIIPNPLPEGAHPELVGDATAEGAVTGPQQPELTIQKVAPPNATVGDPLVYAIKVKNVGNSTAHDVIVEDRIPRGSNLEGTIPQAEMTDRKLIWQLGQMEPGVEKLIRIKVIPTEAGEIGSVATVRFVAEVAATTKITTPTLTMDVQGPREVAVGEQATFHFQLANTGDGEARNVYIRNLLPEGFEHAGGRDIEYSVGQLRPGETRDVDLAVTAVGEGSQTLESHLNTGTTTRAKTQAAVSVIRSRLLIQRQGPKRRFVGRPADYTTIVSNRSSAALKNVSVIEQLPQGMELAAVPENGHFDKQKRTITWRIAQLGAGEQAALKTSVIANEQNVLQWLVQASDASGNQARLTQTLEVAGFASLAVDLEHNGRPVGIGEQVALQLTVKNRGTSSAAGVAATFDIPPHLEFTNAEGPVEFHQDGNKVQFAALDQLEANGEETYKIVLTAREPGQTAVTAQLSTSDGAQPLQHTEQVIVEGDGP